MAVLKMKDIRRMPDEDLRKRLKELQIELIKNSSQKATQGVAIKTKEIKKAIARILTYTNSKK